MPVKSKLHDTSQYSNAAEYQLQYSTVQYDTVVFSIVWVYSSMGLFIRRFVGQTDGRNGNPEFPINPEVSTKVNVSQIIFRFRAFISCIIANHPPRITVIPTVLNPSFPNHFLWLYRSKYWR